MIALLAALATAAHQPSKPSLDLEFFCPVRTSLNQQANFWFEQNPKWRVQFVGYLGSARQTGESRRGAFNRISWRHVDGGLFEAEINWSNSFGSTGVAATVKVKDEAAGREFEGSCRVNPARDSQ